MVTPQQIAVVVQGPIVTEGGLTRRCLESLRRVLPGAEVILSTWEGSDVTGLLYDRLVTSADPGPAVALLDGGCLPTNVNRQIVSTRAGLALAEHPFALKFRTDVELLHAGFLDFFHRYPARAAEWQIFSERLVILDHFSRNPARGFTRLFHPSDMLAFGRTDDLRRLWSLPLASTPVRDSNPSAPSEILDRPAIDGVPEQYLWLACLNQVRPVQLPYWQHDAPDLRRLSELTIANNFVILHRRQFSVRLPKHKLNLDEWATLYTHGDWRRLYREHCGGDASGRRDWRTLLKDLAYPKEEQSQLARKFLPGLIVQSERLKEWI